MILSCWILGDDPDRIFWFEIEAKNKVATLKNFIIDKKKLDIRPQALELWNVSIPFDDSFKENLKKFDVHEKPRLPAQTKLSSLFSDQSTDDCLDIIVRVPGFSGSRQLLQLNCLGVKEEANFIFPVEIEAGKIVAELKNAIKEKRMHGFKHVAADELDLWKVSFEVDDNFQGYLDKPTERPLLPLKKLSEVFPEYPAPEHLHIIVNAVPIRDCDQLIVSTSQILSTEDVGTLRAQFLQRFPSTNADLEEFFKRQKNTDKMLYSNQPPEASETIPVTLLHPIFGQFIDDCENYKPTPEDNTFVFDLSNTMSKFYPYERRAAEIIHSFHHYGLPLRQTWDIDYWTDQYINNGLFQFALINIGSERAEPFDKSLHCYLEWTRSRAPEMPNSVLPFIIINVFGPHMSISGAAWNLRPAIQVLSPMLPFHFHLSDTKMRTTAARYMGSLKKAIRSLQDYYRNHLPAINASIPPSYTSLDACQMFPYPKHFTSLVDSTKQDFEYVKQYKDQYLIFFGKLSDGYDICIKFTRQYSPEVHSFCASKGFAPSLLGCEMIPGGWWMVVMERIDESHEELCVSSRKPLVPVLEELRAFLSCLHQKGFVHGDIRGTNIMVPRSGEDDILLIDFDWAGIIGEVRYPMNVNRCYELWRPDGARDGELIIPEHDDEMLEHMFSLYDIC